MADDKKVFVLEEHLQDKELDLNEYTHIRAYHACRPIDIQKYLTEGLQIISRKQALKASLDRIKSDFITEEEIKKKFNENWKELDDIHKRVWLKMNKEELLSWSGHYLIYGSEFINALATELGCKSSLKKVGIPTIFHCNIPLNNISSFSIMDIEEGIVSGDTEDISIEVDEVASQNIINYEHPKKVLDLYCNMMYRPNYGELKKLGYISDKL